MMISAAAGAISLYPGQGGRLQMSAWRRLGLLARKGRCSSSIDSFSYSNTTSHSFSNNSHISSSSSINKIIAGGQARGHLLDLGEARTGIAPFKRPFGLSKSQNWAAMATVRFSSTSSNQTPPGSGTGSTKIDPNIAVGKDSTTSSGSEVEEKKEGKYAVVTKALKGVWKSVVEAVRDPKAVWIEIKEVARHYYVSTKLLWSEMKIAMDIMKRVVQGSSLTRRERQQLTRTFGDMLRLIPMAVFVIVPFMEFLLPFALKIFPNMLPSTFTDKLKKEENMKKELHLRLSLAGFLNDSLKEVAMKKSGEEKSGALDVLSFIDKTRQGVPMSNDTILRMARLFKDELTLANIARPQLMSMCQYMNIKPYGADAFLRYQLRTRLRDIKEDDRRILWDGIDTLTVEELQEACRVRGMRSFGLTHFGYKRILQEWLDLSIQKNIPIALLIISRALNLSTNVASTPEEVLKNSISSLTDATINEVVIENASQGEERSVDIQKRKLESIQFQKEMIEVERVESEAAKPPVQAVAPTAPEPTISTTESIKTAISAAVSPLVEKISASVSSGKDKEKEKESKTPIGTSLDPMASTIKDSAVNLSVSSASKDKDSAVDLSISKPQSADTDADKVAVEIKAASTATNSSPTPAAATAEAPKSEIKLTVHEMEALGDLARGSSVEREKAEIAILQAQVESVKEAVFEQVVKKAEAAAVIETARVEKAEAAAAIIETAVKKAEAAAAAVVDAHNGKVSSPVAGSSSSGEPSVVSTSSAPPLTDDVSTIKAPEEKEKKVKTPVPHVVTEEDKNVLRMQSMLAGMLGKLKTQIDTTEKEIGNKLTTLDLDQDGEITSEEFKEALTKILARKPTDAEINEIVSVLDVDRDGKVSVVELLQFVESRKMKEEVEVLEEKVKSSQKAAEVSQKAADGLVKNSSESAGKSADSTPL